VGHKALTQAISLDYSGLQEYRCQLDSIMLSVGPSVPPTCTTTVCSWAFWNKNWKTDRFVCV